MSWIILIPVIAAGLSLLGIVLELFMYDREKAKKLEFAIRRKQREIKKYQKEKDTKAMMACQKELMGLMGQNMKFRMKTMAISLPLFFLVLFFLRSTLAVAPLEAGSVSQLGLDIRNLDESAAANLSLELNSREINLIGNSTVPVSLEAYGDKGDRRQIWWNVSAPAGKHSYSVAVNLVATNSSAVRHTNDTVNYTIAFVDKDSLSAGFNPQGGSKLLGGKLELSPLYHPVRISIFGMQLDWYIYYILSFFIIAVAISPLKNQILWGHPKGIKHLEMLESQKNEAKQE